MAQPGPCERKAIRKKRRVVNKMISQHKLAGAPRFSGARLYVEQKTSTLSSRRHARVLLQIKSKTIDYELLEHLRNKS